MRKGTNTFGVIVSNRNFFPNSLVEEGREQLLRTIEELGYKAVTLSLEETPNGAVETRPS